MTSLSRREAAVLRGYLDRLLSWDQRAAVRIQARPAAIGVYAALPHDIVAFLAIPAQGEDGDVTRPVADVRAVLGDDRPDDSIDVDLLTGEEVIGSASLASLPPSEGWQMPIAAVAEDLTPRLDEAVAEYRVRAATLDARTQQMVQDEIWSRSAWAGLPLRVLHVARQLGFLVPDSTRVTAATLGPWKRFSTVRGQVFLRVRDNEALLKVTR